MESFATWIGIAAALLSALSNLPQVRKAWPRNSTHDLSLNTLVALSAGLTLWTIYGLLREDWVVALSNIVGAILTFIVLGCKIRDRAKLRADVGNR